jgi:tight adherence protein C
MTTLFYVSVLMTFLCGMGLLGSVILTRTSRATSDRLFTVANRSAELPVQRSWMQELKLVLLTGATGLREALKLRHKAELLERLVAAGIKSPTARDLYAVLRVVGPLTGAALGMLCPSRRIFFSALFAGVAYLGPDIILQRMIKSRRERIRLGIPDAVDLLVICVDAGLGLDQAMMRVSQELETSHPDIHLEFQTINREQRAGMPRLEAWQSMASRTSLAEIDSFVNMLMQTERFGTPVARALSNFADGLRQKRRQRAEELAAKTTVKIIFPLVFFIFPSLFVVLVGPAAINIVRGLAGAGQ